MALDAGVRMEGIPMIRLREKVFLVCSGCEVGYLPNVTPPQ